MFLLLDIKRCHCLVVAPRQLLPTSGDIEGRRDPHHVHQALSVIASYRRCPRVTLAELRVAVSDPVTEPPLAAARHRPQILPSGNPLREIHLRPHRPRNGRHDCRPWLAHCDRALPLGGLRTHGETPPCTSISMAHRLSPLRCLATSSDRFLPLNGSYAM